MLCGKLEKKNNMELIKSSFVHASSRGPQGSEGEEKSLQKKTFEILNESKPNK